MKMFVGMNRADRAVRVELPAEDNVLHNSTEDLLGTKDEKNFSLPEFNTLDEPVIDTIMRDLKAVWIKLMYVLYPKGEKSLTLLKEWDLWGPFLICFLLAIFLQGDSGKGPAVGSDPEFAEMFAILWIGAGIVALNSKLLGGHMSFFQSVCILGYCLLPSLLSLNICLVILLLQQTNFLFFLRFLVTMVGFAWATYASMVFLGNSQPAGKKGLTLYPIFLFYFFISWVILSHTYN